MQFSKIKDCCVLIQSTNIHVLQDENPIFSNSESISGWIYILSFIHSESSINILTVYLHTFNLHTQV